MIGQWRCVTCDRVLETTDLHQLLPDSLAHTVCSLETKTLVVCGPVMLTAVPERVQPEHRPKSFGALAPGAKP